MRAATDHENVHLTMIRLVENGSVSRDDFLDKKLDNAKLGEFRDIVAENNELKYIEEVVMDGSGTIAVVRSTDEAYELIIVGHRHGDESQLMTGLTYGVGNNRGHIGISGFRRTFDKFNSSLKQRSRRCSHYKETFIPAEMKCVLR